MTRRGAVCVIPARYASTRLPGKPLIEIAGVPLVMWAYNRARAAGVFSTVVVATDDQRIVDAVGHCGGAAVMTSAQHLSGTDRVLEAVHHVGGDYIVNLQGDEPLIAPFLLQEFSAALPTLDDTSLLTCVTNATIEEMADPNTVKAVLGDQGRALYFSRSAIPYCGRSEVRTGLKHIGIYGFTRKSLELFCSLPPGSLETIEKLEQLRALEAGMTIRCIRREDGVMGIDTPEDLDAFRQLVKETAISPEGTCR
jgi:3-deoxy-D-manno-octulosonate cytidylyltransferase